MVFCVLACVTSSETDVDDVDDVDDVTNVGWTNTLYYE